MSRTWKLKVGMPMEDAAYCAAAWASGETQKSLGETLGCRNTKVCIAIGDFLDAFSGQMVTYSTGPFSPSGLVFEDRKALVPLAISRYRRWREEKMA